MHLDQRRLPGDKKQIGDSLSAFEHARQQGINSLAVHASGQG
jgi:hypothetical protein